MQRTVGFGLALGLLGMFAAPAPEAEAQVQLAPVTALSTVFIGCSNSGSNQDVAKSPLLKNTTTSPIPKGTLLKWSASDGDKGTVTLTTDLAAGGTVKAQGTKPGNVYRCNADFQAKPDLVVKNVTWSGASSVKVEIGNLDVWASAGQSSVHLEMVSCGGTVLKSVMIGAGGVGKSSSTSVDVTATKPSGKYYFKVRADAASQIIERNETNNVWDGINACLG